MFLVFTELRIKGKPSSLTIKGKESLWTLSSVSHATQLR